VAEINVYMEENSCILAIADELVEVLSGCFFLVEDNISRGQSARALVLLVWNTSGK
jgi:hypothetical protein